MTANRKKKIRNRLKKLINLKEISRAEQEEINAIYKEVTDKTVPYTTCGNRVRQRIVEVYQIVKI